LVTKANVFEGETTSAAWLYHNVIKPHT